MKENSKTKLFKIQPLLNLCGSCFLENWRVNKERVNKTYFSQKK
jgi:hypothetical protein